MGVVSGQKLKKYKVSAIQCMAHGAQDLHACDNAAYADTTLPSRCAAIFLRRLRQSPNPGALGAHGNARQSMDW